MNHADLAAVKRASICDSICDQRTNGTSQNRHENPTQCLFHSCECVPGKGKSCNLFIINSLALGSSATGSYIVTNFRSLFPIFTSFTNASSAPAPRASQKCNIIALPDFPVTVVTSEARSRRAYNAFFPCRGLFAVPRTHQGGFKYALNRGWGRPVPTFSALGA